MEHHQALLPSGERLDIIELTRADWGGGPVRAGHQVDPSQFVGWVLHHTVMVMPDYDRDGFLAGDLDDIFRYMRHLQTVRPDLGGEVPYSWLPFPGAHPLQVVIAEGRGRGRTGAHTAGLNSTRYAWSLPGNHELTPVTAAQVWGMRWLASRETPDADRQAIGHRHAPPYFSRGTNLNATACPGRHGVEVLPLLHPPYPPFPRPGARRAATPEEDPMRLVEITEKVRADRGQATRLFLVAGPRLVPVLDLDLADALADNADAPHQLTDGASLNLLDGWSTPLNVRDA